VNSDELVEIANRVEAAKRYAAVSKREGVQAVKDREALLEELLQYKTNSNHVHAKPLVHWAPPVNIP